MKEIVIKIPDDVYNGIVDEFWYYGMFGHLLKAVKNGTELPKGHGELKDANILSERKEIMTTTDGEKVFAVRVDDVIGISPIIEADKGEE